MPPRLEADQVGRAALVDPQFTVPRRPALRRGVRLRRDPGGTYLDGADRPQRFEGAFAREGLPGIAQALDGHRDVTAIARETGLDPDVVQKCLALLWTAGAIEEGSATARPDDPYLATVLSRLGNSTAVNPSWDDAAAALTKATVRFVGDSDLVRRARAVLGHLTPDDGLSDPALTVILHQGAVPVVLHCDGPTVRIRVDGAHVVVGPYVDPEVTPCLACGTRTDPAPASRTDPAGADLALGLAGHHVMALLTRAVPSHLPADVAVVATGTLSTRYHPVVSAPGCPTCRGTDDGPVKAPPRSAVYEASVALPPRRFLAPRDHQAHFYTENQALQFAFRAWPGRPRLALPDADVRVLDTPGASAGRLDPDTLSLLLAVGFGLDPERSDDAGVKRWTASGGNIGCTNAYLVARRVPGVPAGVHAYAPREHALVPISDDLPPGGTADCEVVVTGDLRKIMTKYGTFGMRLIFLDAGCALTSIRDAADALGVPARPRITWDDEAIARRIGTTLADEPVAAVIDLGGTT